MGCRDASETYLKIINGLVISISIIILGYSAYLAATVGDSLSDVDLNDPLLVTVIFGAIMFVFGLIGILGSCWDSKTLLFVYLIGSLLLSAGVLASGVALLSYGGYLKDVREGRVDNNIQETIQNFQLACFENCCDGTVVFCDPANVVQPCVTDKEQFQGFLESVGQNTCNALEELDVNGHALVGPIIKGSCGGGSARFFVNDFNDFVEENLKTMAALNIAAGIILLLSLICACYLICTDEDDNNRK